MKIYFIFASLLFVSTGFSQTKLNIGSNEVLVDLPDVKPVNNRLVVIAPAKKYTMNKPLFVDLSQRLVSQGYIVTRFNWSFVKTNSDPSSDLVKEGKELYNIISSIQKKYSVTKSNTYLVAKSFGSRVLMKSKIDGFDHVSLMTPNCDKKNSFHDTYAPMFKKKIRININISIDDPYCDVEQIYDFVSSRSPKVTLFTTYGDHNFKTNKFSKENQELVLLQIVNWIKQN